MLITEEYRQQQKALHQTGNYGIAAEMYAPMVAALLKQAGLHQILDYGAGSKLSLIRAMRAKEMIGREIEYSAYEPAVEELSESPEPAEMVVCLDVLEHIEPECLDAVLDDLKRVTVKMGVFTVATGPAKKILPDGRNAHLIQETAQWWLPKIMARFRLRRFEDEGNGFLVIVNPLED